MLPVDGLCTGYRWCQVKEEQVDLIGGCNNFVCRLVKKRKSEENNDSVS
jgi:hypothetical protein